MTAVLIPTGSEAEWLEARRQGITASEIAVVMGLSPYSSPYALYHQKLGILDAPEQDDAMQLGSYMEQFVADRFAGRHREFCVAGDGRQLYAHPDRAWQLATPDRQLFDDFPVNASGPVALLETKIDGGSDDWGDEGTDDIPVHYRAQVLWQMDVMGVSTVYVAAFIWHRRKVRVYELHLDDDARADLGLMRSEAREFLDRIDCKDEPDVDWRPATLDALRTLHAEPGEADIPVRRSLVTQYRAAVRRYKAAEQRKDEMTARMLHAIGDGRRAVDIRTGEPIATRSVSHPKRISTTMLREKYPAIAAECTPEPSPQVKLTPAKPKKDKTS